MTKQNVSQQRQTTLDEVHNQAPKNDNVPELRFPEFTDEWETVKLKDICTFSKGKGISKSDITDEGTDCIRYGELYTKYNELIDTTFSKTNIPKEKLILSEKNDIIIPSTGETAIDISQASCIIRDNIAIGGDINILKTKENGIFLSYCLNNHKYDIAKLTQGISVMHLYADQLKHLKIKIPSRQEQEKIIKLLLTLSSKIILMEKKHSLYKNMKKYFLQNMFPSKDENIPNLRFPEFKDEWLDFKLKDLFISKKGKGLSKDKVSNNGKYNCILYGELYTTYSQIITNIKSKTNFDEGVLSHEKDILIPCSTTTTGKDLANASVLLKKDVFLGGDITILRKKKEIMLNEVYFAYYLSYGLNKKLTSLTQGSTIIHLYWNHMKNIKVYMPSKDEQDKIVNLFKTIDDKIDCISLQCSILKDFKEGLLQKMFC